MTIQLVEVIAHGQRMQAVELHHLRIPPSGLRRSTRRFATHVQFEDRYGGRIIRMTKDEWEALGQPTYVVCQVRCETFGESTQ